MLLRIAFFACLIVDCFGRRPWNHRGRTGKTQPVTEACRGRFGNVLYVPEGFKIELQIHTAAPKTEVSWICMTKDHKGRLIISGQNRQPILRFTLKNGNVAAIEKLDLPISEAMGMLYAFDSLYVNGAGPKGFGLYRCKDTKGTDQFDDVQLLKRFNSGMSMGLWRGPRPRQQDLCDETAASRRCRRESSRSRRIATIVRIFCCPKQWTATASPPAPWRPGGYVVRSDAERQDLGAGAWRLSQCL